MPRLRAANTLYLFCAKVVQLADEVGCLVSVENPAGSYMWQTSTWKVCSTVPLLRVLLHHCMFGSRRKKYTALECNFPAARALAVTCSGEHEHEPWGRLPGGSWATAAECAYPPALCVALAQAVIDQLLCLGATNEGRSLDTASPPLAQAAAAASARQPRGKRLKPLVSEHAQVVRLQGATKDLVVPAKLTAPVAIPQQVQSSPDLASLPGGRTLPACRQQSFAHPIPRPSPYTLPWGLCRAVAGASGC